MNDVEIVQSFLRRYLNKNVREHFGDISGNDDGSLSLSVPRQAIKLVCLHKDTDPLMLTILRCLIFWVEARGLFDDFIFGMPSTEFDIKFNYHPQVKLHFLENRYDSSTNNRRPIRSEVSFRWREDNFSSTNINALATKIHADFGKPVFKIRKGRDCYTYYDDRKGYQFTVYVQSELEAKSIIQQAIGIQDNEVPDWENNLRPHGSNVNYSVQETVKVQGKTIKKPKRRPVGTVEYRYAELFIPGTTKPIILSDVSGYKPEAIKYG